MSDPIDLDLVELRCKLRGWTHVRFVEDGVDHVSVECRYGGELILGGDGWVGRESGWDAPAHKQIEALLTAPRRTLERLLSEPPEGWSITMRPDAPTKRPWRCEMAWGERGLFPRRYGFGSSYAYELLCKVSGAPGAYALTAQFVDGETNNLARLAERHKAAAELALILAEVEP